MSAQDFLAEIIAAGRRKKVERLRIASLPERPALRIYVAPDGEQVVYPPGYQVPNYMRSV